MNAAISTRLRIPWSSRSKWFFWSLDLSLVFRCGEVVLEPHNKFLELSEVLLVEVKTSILNFNPFFRYYIWARAIEKDNILRIFCETAELIWDAISSSFFLLQQIFFDFFKRFSWKFSMILDDIHVTVARDDIPLDDFIKIIEFFSVIQDKFGLELITLLNFFFQWKMDEDIIEEFPSNSEVLLALGTWSDDELTVSSVFEKFNCIGHTDVFEIRMRNLSWLKFLHLFRLNFNTHRLVFRFNKLSKKMIFV